MRSKGGEVGCECVLRSKRPMLRAQRNCWCIETASRASVIVDTAAYFDAFAEACRKARERIVILGWDFDRRERLYREAGSHGLPDELGAFLAELVKRRPGLHIYLLPWDFNLIYAAERELLPALRMRAQAPPRLHFRLDGRHPKGASHHQKVVVVDDRIAFAGGIDLSRWRWDTPEHAPQDPRRVDADGRAYPPFHDVMMLVEGEPAQRLGELARQRWRRAGGRRLKPVTAAPEHSPWPEGVQAQFIDVPVAIARTEPRYRGRQAVREVRQLYLDAIAEAQDVIYIENQYFTARCLADALIGRLRERDGPEVVIVLPMHTGGWLEQVTMDVLRARMVERMREADAHGRLQIYYPYQPGLGDQCISVHAKLLIVDDRLLRIGSSNTSNRSMGLDTECDLAIESASEGDAVQERIRQLRLQLLGEHLGCADEAVGRSERERGGFIAGIEALRSDGRSLRSLDCTVSDELDQMVPDTALVDPSEPYSADYFVTQYVPKSQRAAGRRRLALFIVVLLALLAMAAAWRWTPLQELLSPRRLSALFAALPSQEVRALAAVAGFALASLFMVPLTLLAVISGIVFGGWQSVVYMLIAALLSAALGFLAGRVLGREALQRFAGQRLSRLSRRLAERGTVAVALLRLVPVAPFSVFNFVAGGSHLSFRQFFLGSLLGLAPGLAGVTVFSDTLWGAITSPSPVKIALAGAIGVALFVFARLTRRWLRSG